MELPNSSTSDPWNYRVNKMMKVDVMSEGNLKEADF